MSPVRYPNIKTNRNISNGVKILVVAGASGGHIFPATGFIDSLKNKRSGLDILLVLPKKASIARMAPAGYRVSYISLSSLKLKFNFASLVTIGKLIKGSLESMIALIKFRPDAVVGFGSIISVPAVFSACFLRIPALIHEQNVAPGRANRFLANFCGRVAVSFPETKNYFRPSLRKKIVVTGNPIRGEFKKIDKYEALESFGLKPGKFTVLVMGGSSGSHSINMSFLNAASIMPDKAKMQVIHLCGDKDYDLLDNGYKKIDIDVRLFRFLGRMPYAYAAADLVICRAGALTIAELMFSGAPAIIIPYPFAYAHQLDNAMVLKRRGCARILSDNQLQPIILKDAIEELINNPQKLKDMRSGYSGIANTDAAGLLAAEALSLAGGTTCSE